MKIIVKKVARIKVVLNQNSNIKTLKKSIHDINDFQGFGQFIEASEH